MDSILTSIQPKWCELIAIGRKTWEVRKNRPQCDTPFKCYVYCTASDVHSCLVVGGGSAELFRCCNYKTAFVGGGVVGNGKVIGEFVCDRIELLKYNSNGYSDEWHEWNDEYVDYTDMCLSEKELEDYLGASNGCAWHISDLVIYDTPKELGEFVRPLDRANCGYKDCGAYDCGRCTMTERVCEKRIITRPPQSWCFAEALRI